MRHETHRRLAKLFCPNVTYKKIDAINSCIDNPSRKAEVFNEMTTSYLVPTDSGKKYFNPYDYYNLAGTAHHRRVNHDPVSALTITAMEHGMDFQTAALVNLHLKADALGEEMRKNYGAVWRDLVEAKWNVALDSMVKGRRRSKGLLF